MFLLLLPVIRKKKVCRKPWEGFEWKMPLFGLLQWNCTINTWAGNTLCVLVKGEEHRRCCLDQFLALWHIILNYPAMYYRSCVSSFFNLASITMKVTCVSCILSHTARKNDFFLKWTIFLLGSQLLEFLFNQALDQPGRKMSGLSLLPVIRSELISLPKSYK